MVSSHDPITCDINDRQFLLQVIVQGACSQRVRDHLPPPVRALQNVAPQGAVLLTVGRSYVGNDVTHSTLLDRACACSYENLPKYRSYRVSNTAPWTSSYLIQITLKLQNECLSLKNIFRKLNLVDSLIETNIREQISRRQMSTTRIQQNNTEKLLSTIHRSINMMAHRLRASYLNTNKAEVNCSKHHQTCHWLHTFTDWLQSTD